MNIVEPTERTTLLLTRAWQPLAIITARACIHHIVRGRVKGLDAKGNTFTWDESEFAAHQHDQPVLRSAHAVHLVPTIAICTSSFIRRKKRDPFLSTRAVFKLYKGICQYCLKKIPYSQATKDHYYPKSLGGTNHDFNLVLACKKCNCIKDSQFPYTNVNGEEVKPKAHDSLKIQLFDQTRIRGEWKPLLYH